MSDLILHVASLVAAFFQSVTGVGFGMIAGPVILIVLEDPGAVVISTCLSWLVALCLFPFLRRGTDLGMMLRLLAGAAIGLPLGLWVWGVADILTLKLIAGVTIGGLTAMMLLGAPGIRTPGLVGDLVFGALGGFFGGCLAMPGPTATMRMTAQGYDKAVIRATMVSFFMCVWPLIFAGQSMTRAIPMATWINAGILVPATLGGIVLGNYAATRVSEKFFRRLVVGFLILTSASLLLDVVRTAMGE
ncbi:MAG: TSUP family transporter [Paracoccaceae bacterium]